MRDPLRDGYQLRERIAQVDELHQMTLREIVRQAGLASVLSEIAAYITERQLERAAERAKIESLPASQAQQIALETLIRRLRDLALSYDTIYERFKRIAGVPSREELDSAAAAKVIYAFAAWADELEAEQARLDGHIAAEQADGVPF